MSRFTRYEPELADFKTISDTKILLCRSFSSVFRLCVDFFKDWLFELLPYHFRTSLTVTFDTQEGRS